MESNEYMYLQGLIRDCVTTFNAAQNARIALDSYCQGVYDFSLGAKGTDEIVKALTDNNEWGTAVGLSAFKFDCIMKEASKL